MRPMKSSCWNRIRTRAETTTIRRAAAAGMPHVDKESKLSANRMHMKTGNQAHNVPAFQCQV